MKFQDWPRMSNKNKNGLAPTLRFPKFQDADNWEKTTIGNLGSFYYGKSAPKWSLEENAPTHCVRYGELYSKFRAVIYETYSRTNIAPEKLRFSKGGEILVPRVGEKPEDFGKCCCFLPLKNIAIGEMISVFETKENPLFYTYYFRRLYREFAKVVEGQNVKNLYYAVLEPIPIYRPSIKEQLKIGECLCSLDELIFALTRKHVALLEYKKWLMQSLFPADSESVPELRFPEFSDRENWQEKKLSDLMIRVSNQVDVDPMKTYQEIGIRSHGKGIFHKEHVTGKKLGNKRVFWVEENVFVVNIVFAWELAVASTSSKEAGMIASHRFPMYEPINGKANSIYMKYFFLTHKGKELLGIASPGGAGRNKTLGQKDFENLTFLAPSVEEQNKIASYLTSVEELIEKQEEKIAQLNSHKNGLMQQLFPEMDKADT